MISKEFLKEASELDQLDAKLSQTSTTGPGLINRGASTVVKDLGNAGKSISDIVSKQVGNTRGLAVTTPTASELADKKPQQQPQAPEQQVKSSPGTLFQVDPRVKDYVQNMAKGKKAAQSTGTTEIDSILKSLGLMD